MENKALYFIISFLGGGIISALINRSFILRSEKRARENEQLANQVKYLYGPLYFFTVLNESLFELTQKFYSANKKHYIDINWSSDSDTQKNIHKETETTIQLGNDYSRMTRDNNKEMYKIIKDNHFYIEPEDTAIFQQFIIDHLRMENEFKVGQPLKTPHCVYREVGEISFMRQNFSDIIKKRFTEKTSKLKSFNK